MLQRMTFLALACTADLSLVACSGPAAASGFCQRQIEDPKTKGLIDAMTAALGQ